MDQAIFIPDKDNILSSQLITALLNRGEKVVTTADAETIGESSENTDNLMIIPWNMKSPLSARSCLLKIQQNVEEFNQVFLPFVPRPSNTAFHEMEPHNIDMELDNYLRGVLYLVREIVRFFYGQKRGRITFLSYIHGNTVLPPLGSLVKSAFESFVESMFLFYGKEDLYLTGFVSQEENAKAFADHVLASLDSINSGKKDKIRNRLNGFPSGSGFPFFKGR